MNPKNDNAVNDFMHEVNNSLRIIGGLATRHDLNILMLEARVLQKAIENFRRKVRKCPYARKKGAKCGHVS